MRVEDAHPSNDRLEHYLKEIESILSTRLPDETFRGQLNVIGAFGVDAPKDEIEKALVSDQCDTELFDLTTHSTFVHNSKEIGISIEVL